MRLIHRSEGFTIIELMIATAVFSTILLLCTTGLITIGRVYRKGNTSRATQEVTRSVMSQIKNDFELSGGYYKPLPSGNGFCIGDNLYSYAIGQKTDLTAGIHGLVMNQPVGGCDTNGSVVAENLNNTTAKELLGQNMRLASLTINEYPSGSANPTAISIALNVVSGDDDLLIGGSRCAGGTGQEYCAGSALESYVTRRLQ